MHPTLWVLLCVMLSCIERKDARLSDYLITGATGDTGRHAINYLLAGGASVRALVHREDVRSERLKEQGVEVVVGDLLDFETAVSALQGVRSAYFLYPILPGLLEATTIFIEAMLEAGTKSVVNMSQMPARREAKSHASLAHWMGEHAFDRAGVEVTHLRPTFFAEWMTYAGTGLAMAKKGYFRFPFGDGRHAPIASVDQGRVIATILQNPESHRGKRYSLVGPRVMSQHEIAAEISATIGKKVEYQPISIDEFRARLERLGMHPFNIQHVESVALDYQNGVFSEENNWVERITGIPPLSVAEFVSENPAAFGVA